MPQQKPIYYIVYDWMIQECRLKGGAERDVYALLYSLADKSGIAKVSLGYLIERTGYSKRAIIAAVNSLMQAGWVMKARQNHYGICEYGICEPASIIGRFDKSGISSAEFAPVITKTSAEFAPEQVQKSNLIGAESAPDTPYIYNFYNKIYNNFFITDDTSEKKEKEILLEEFFNMFGLYQPMDEVMRFWNYHEQTGWKNAKGQKIVNKKSAMMFWRIDEQTARRQSDLAKRILSRLIPAIPQEQRICLIAELKLLYREENTLIFQFETEKPIHILENNERTFAAFKRIVRTVCGNDIRVRYRTELPSQQ